AILAALMVVAMGHLTTLFAVKDAEGGNAWRFCFMCQRPETFDWWAPSRVILDARTVSAPGEATSKQYDPVAEINEFPAFSFLLADLHPHVMALPLWTLAIMSALALSRRRVFRGSRWRHGLPRGLHNWLALVLVGIVIGSLYTTNTWDYPTFLIISLAALALPYLAFQRRGRRPLGWGWARPWAVQSALVVVLSLVSFILFHLTFKSLVGGEKPDIPENLANIPVAGWVLQKLGSLLLINTWDKGITGFLLIFGIFLLAILGWLAYELVSFWSRRGAEGAAGRDRILIGPVTIASLALAVLLRFPLLGLLLPVAVVALYLVWREPQAVERNLVLIMVALSALIGLAIEVVYLRDVFHSRQNTIFKFYYQIWVLWAIAAAYGLWRVLRGAWVTSAFREQAEPLRRSSGGAVWKGLSTVWAGVFGLLVLSGLMYSVYGAISRNGGPNAALRGLDGMTHLSFSAPGDYEAIKWLRENGTGSDVVLECCRDEYNNPGHAGRVSSYTGVPTLVSWDGHENQWRGGQPNVLPEIGARRQLVDQLYSAPGSGQQLLDALHKNRVSYVFVGATERGEGSAAGAHQEERVTAQAEAVYKQVLTPVFTSGSTVIYKVPAPAQQPAALLGRLSEPVEPHP
ncbi:MAG: DUF2298 domain-containing protein, partial [Chloroflexota bacterium]|nr:DUF2298 domain-containing protein [Chloroflexota bacterium]